jgi:hypothetical protein
MSEFWSGARLVDAILILTVLETAGLWAYHRFTGRGLKPQDYLLNLVSGLCLMTGIKTVVMGADWPLTALCLMAAGCAHGADLWLRLRARSAKPS